jgi:predicted O-methyltransferase YrrM
MKNLGVEDILKMAMNFMECRILLSGAELNLFTLLSRTPLSADRIARKIGADRRALTVLLDALSALRLLVKEDGAYRCPDSVSRLLSEKSPDTVLPMVLHAVHLWHRWSGLTGVVLGKHPAKAVASSRTAEEMSAFIGAMHVIASPRAREIVAAVKPGPARFLIDVGGASGTYTIAFLRAVPEMKATLFDRPEVIGMARDRLAGASVLERVSLEGGDFYRDELPGGHDLAFVSAIIHQNSLEENIALFQKVFRSLDRGGRIVIRDPIMGPDRIHPKDGAVFAVNMLLGTRGGGTYTFDEIKDGLTRAGFKRVRLIRKGQRMDALVEAFKP